MKRTLASLMIGLSVLMGAVTAKAEVRDWDRYAQKVRNERTASDLAVCMAATTMNGDWETGRAHDASYVQEARIRGLTLDRCGFLTGRRGSRSAESPIQANSPAKATKVYSSLPLLISGGSGFSITRDGYVLTNHHVVEDCQIVTVHPGSGVKKAEILATDNRNDLALLKINHQSSVTMVMSSSNAALLEDIVVAGYPLSDSLSDTVKVTKGVVSSLAGLNNDYSLMQMDAAVQPGNSGGPVLDERGNVVGITVSQLAKRTLLLEKGVIPENTNFAIKSSVAKTFVEANGVISPEGSAKRIDRKELAKLITDATHFIGCWVTGERAQQALADKKKHLAANSAVVRQVATFD